MPLPVAAYTVVLGSNYQTSVPLILNQNANSVVEFDFVDAAGNPVSLLGKSLKFTAWESIDVGPTKQVLFTRDNGGGGGITIVGTSNNGVQVSFTQANTSALLTEWTVFEISSLTDEQVLVTGPISIRPSTQ